MVDRSLSFKSLCFQVLQRLTSREASSARYRNAVETVAALHPNLDAVGDNHEAHYRVEPRRVQHVLELRARRVDYTA